MDADVCLPHTRVIRRQDLLSSPSSPEPSSASEGVEELFKTRLSDIFGAVESEAVTEPRRYLVSNAIQETESHDGIAFQFRLFSTPRQHGDDSARENGMCIVRVESPSLDSKEAGFISKFRPREFYLSGMPSEEQRDRFEEAAVTGDDVRKMAGRPWPGCALPWRVVPSEKVLVNTSSLPIGRSALPTSKPLPKRPGKKRRIVTRKRLAAQKAKQQEEERNLLEKEHTLREKKARKNRAQKERRKAQKKAEKTIGTLAQDH